MHGETVKFGYSEINRLWSISWTAQGKRNADYTRRYYNELQSVLSMGQQVIRRRLFAEIQS